MVDYKIQRFQGVAVDTMGQRRTEPAAIRNPDATVYAVKKVRKYSQSLYR
jgi:hypothetical protein